MHKAIVLAAGVILSGGGLVWAGDMVQPAAVVQEIEINNKICPVSGEKVGVMEKILKVKHNGKIYQLCCSMCEKDFNKNPDKYTKIAEDEIASTRQ